jgi:hypothetical protein
MNIPPQKLYIRYLHHGKMVWVRSDLLGSHKQHCLCWSCAKLLPGQKENCPIAQKLYEINKEHNLVTPVYECPEFVLKVSDVGKS